MSDMAILTVSSDGGSASWLAASGSGSAPAGRYYHNAALAGSTLLLAFGTSPGNQQV